MNKPEILSPAGSFEGVRAAVQNGADAVYMGFGRFNARRNAKNFTDEEITEAIAYCRQRKVKTNITVNTLPSDREFSEVIRDIETVYKAGADALIVQDLGLVRVIHELFPSIEIHGSTQMTVNTLDGALMAKRLGLSRIVLSRELSFDNIKHITKNCGIETEVFIHGALCMCYSGQCYLSSVIGQRSGNRGLCAQPCRLPYSYNSSTKKRYPLSLKDLSLVSYLEKLEEAGVSSLKIEGRMKRAEYTAIVTKIYSDVLKENRHPTKAEIKTLEKVFSRDGFTDGYFTGNKGIDMFGTKTDVPFDQVRDIYEISAKTFSQGSENRKQTLDFNFEARKNENIKLTLKCGDVEALVIGNVAEKAINKFATEQSVLNNLLKLGGTPFKQGEAHIKLDDGLLIRASEINALRRTGIDKISNKLTNIDRECNKEYMKLQNNDKKSVFQGYTVQVKNLCQITNSIIKNPPKTIYIPLESVRKDEQILNFMNKGLPFAVVLPRIYDDSEKNEIEELLKKTKSIGIDSVVCTNIGQVEFVKQMGFKVYGDFGLNVFNSECLKTIEKTGILRQTLSFELRLAQIRDIIKPIDTEIIVYGYLPLMIFENCAIKNNTGKCICKNGITSITDRKGIKFALMPEFGCRNTLYNSQPVHFGEKSSEYKNIGIKYGRIMFTTENHSECERIYKAITEDKTIKFENGTTGGLYYRGVE